MLRVGCIGCGAMGGAVLAGLARHGGYDLYGYNRTPERMAPLEALGVQRMESACAVAAIADIVVLAVKPQQVTPLLHELHASLRQDSVLVSVAAGVSLRRLIQAVEGHCPVVRCMPNTPALVGMGIFALCFEDAKLTAKGRDAVLQLFTNLGLCFDLPESRFIAFSALIGAGPAYVFSVMQGLIQAGVTLGFQHKDARQMVTTLLAGSAMLAEQSGKPIMQLRDDVCSPGGLTIAGVNALDRAALSGIFVDAVAAAATRAHEMED